VELQPLQGAGGGAGTNDERGTMNAEQETRNSGSRWSFIVHRSSFIIAFVLGAFTVAGYAPFYYYPLPVVTLVGLFYLWSQAATARAVFTRFRKFLNKSFPEM
jgi:hypothetical protein